MGGKTNVQAPQPSAEERALQQEQVNLLRESRSATQEQMRQQELLAPVLYEQMGITPQMDASGRIVGYGKAPEDPLQAQFKQLQQTTMQQALAEMNDPQRKEIDAMLRGRTLAALKGELPVDPGLERQLKEGRTTLEEQLRMQLGSGYATSTPGIQALSEFDKRATELRTSAQTGQLTLAEQLGQARQAGLTNTAQMAIPGMELADRFKSSNFGNIMGLRGSGWQGVQGLSGVAQGYNNPLSMYQNQRGMQMQANMANAQSANQRFGVFGSLFGTGLMAAAAMSDRRLKRYIHRVGKLLNGLNLYRYVIFGRTQVGVMADEVKKRFPHAVHRVGAFDAVDYTQIV